MFITANYFTKHSNIATIYKVYLNKKYFQKLFKCQSVRHEFRDRVSN